MSESYTTESALQAIAEAHPGRAVFLYHSVYQFPGRSLNEMVTVSVDKVFGAHVVTTLADAVEYAKTPERYNTDKAREIAELESKLAALKAA